MIIYSDDVSSSFFTPMTKKSRNFEVKTDRVWKREKCFFRGKRFRFDSMVLKSRYHGYPTLETILETLNPNPLSPPNTTHNYFCG